MLRWHEHLDAARHPGLAADEAGALIFVLAGMSVLANWFCLRSVDRLGAVNRTLAQNVSPARLALSEAKSAIAGMGLATYKTMAAIEREATREAGQEIRSHYEVARLLFSAET